MTLYLKYRPQTIDELDLENVRSALTNIVESGNIPHAFLFSGPKGTGKTSAARIMAKIINCEAKVKPCNKCDQCISIMKGSNLDVIELDAASNRGIDDIRNLKENILLAPFKARKKIYIIDEAHMLTTEASNAFLKTLEEPPAHVIFILATTNPEKLPSTVISRLTKVNFTKATPNDVVRQLGRVVKGEGLKISDVAILKIGQNAEGSFRDAVKILESLSLSGKKISDEDVERFLQDNPDNAKLFFDLLEKNDSSKLLSVIEDLSSKGVNVKNFTTQLIATIHLSLLAKNNLGEDTLPAFSPSSLIILYELLSESLSNMSISPMEQLPLEVAVLKFLNPSATVTRPDGETPLIEEETVEVVTEKKQQSKPYDDKVNEKEKVAEIKPKVEKKMTVENVKKDFDNKVWQQILPAVRLKNASIEGLLRAAEGLTFNKNTLTIGVFYQFHKEKLETPSNKKILEDVVGEVMGQKGVSINFILTERKFVPRREYPSKPDVTPVAKKADADIISAAKEIFGT